MEIEVKKVWFEDDHIFIQTVSGEERSHPLKWFPRLLNASSDDRENYELSPFGIHWEKLDEDLSFEGFFCFFKEEAASNFTKA
ncbi:DUF2442 domain-containing protein [Dyadobacter sandarakinus]|uniref:DUF2442 domain-containing protein n=1 Tax=Dyadobacter sandarakinus TaxID=2747268 RepID=A0ABX7I8T8_9BACT|nr:DUF2442 domain-containing protein [Dyadobacter sandarakinus]QRR02200.1 DUF2442 domain-containing protein [Dyadobacter sandarakinus]